MPEHAYQISVGVVLLAVLTIAYGGTFVLGVTRGNIPANELQRRFFRAGHAHAGVLVILGLLALTLEQLNHVRAPYPAISFGILAAAVLMPAGFFLSVIGRDPARPNRDRAAVGRRRRPGHRADLRRRRPHSRNTVLTHPRRPAAGATPPGTGSGNPARGGPPCHGINPGGAEPICPSSPA